MEDVPNFGNDGQQNKEVSQNKETLLMTCPFLFHAGVSIHNQVLVISCFYNEPRLKNSLSFLDPGFIPSEIPLGEPCGSCYCPPTYTAGNCAKGLTCKHDPRIADAPGECVDNVI